MKYLSRLSVLICVVFLLLPGCDLVSSEGDGDPPTEDDKAVVDRASSHYA